MSETHAIPTCFCRISYAATATFARRKTARHLRASRRRARRQRHFGCIEIVDVDVAQDDRFELGNAIDVADRSLGYRQRFEHAIDEV